MRAIFLDRDGVICENRSDHVKTWQEFQFIPGAIESIVALSRLGLPIVVVTNQAVIGRGMAPASAIEDVHNRMVAQITARGGHIDRVLYCPHLPHDNCSCRKPEPGMLLRAAHELGLDLARSYMVGDALTDLIAGQQVGCRTFLVLTGRGFEELTPALDHLGDTFTVCRNLVHVTTHILKSELDMGDRSEWLNRTDAHRYRHIMPALTGV